MNIAPKASGSGLFSEVVIKSTSGSSSKEIVKNSGGFGVLTGIAKNCLSWQIQRLSPKWIGNLSGIFW